MDDEENVRLTIGESRKRLGYPVDFAEEPDRGDAVKGIFCGLIDDNCLI
jgi:hypothetical protein